MRTRVDIWLDPWADPLGAGYQVIQALYAFGRGGILGTGLGAGLPEIGGVPADPAGAHRLRVRGAWGRSWVSWARSPSAACYLVIAERGLRIAARAPDEFQALLAAGLTLVVVLQAALIMAANLRLVPLTGVTLPFVSYGGSSLLTNALVVGLLLALSDRRAVTGRAGRRPSASAARWPPDAGARASAAGCCASGLVLCLVYALIAVGAGWLQVVQAGPLSEDPRNPLQLAAERAAPRGRILDARGVVVADNARARRTASAGGATRTRRWRPSRATRASLFGTAGPGADLRPAAGGPRPAAAGRRAAPEVPRRCHPTRPTCGCRSTCASRSWRRACWATSEAPSWPSSPSTGRVLALVSTPGYDPRTAGRPGDRAAATWRALDQDAAAPLAGPRDPGSVRARVGVQAGDRRRGPGVGRHRPRHHVRRPARRVAARLPPRRLPHPGCGADVQLDHPLDLDEAMEVSSNIWFAHAGLAAGRRGTVVGRGAASASGRPSTSSCPPSSSQVNGGDGPLDGFADRVELANAAYGQAEVLATPLQMALVAAAIANDGVLMQPTLVDRLVSENGNEVRIEPRAIGRVMSAETCGDAAGRHGPGRRGSLRGDAMRAAPRCRASQTAGKSGTAQLGPGQAPHSWFVGFAPADEPRIAIAVVVENAGSGSEPRGAPGRSAHDRVAATVSRRRTDARRRASDAADGRWRTIRVDASCLRWPRAARARDPHPHEDAACPRSRSRLSGSPPTSSG